MRTLLATLGLLAAAGSASAQHYTTVAPSQSPRYNGYYTPRPDGYVSPVQNFYAGGAPVAVIRPGAYPIAGTPAFGYPGLGYPAYSPKASNATMFRGR